MLKKIKAIMTGAVIIASLTVTAGAQQDFTFLTPDGQSVSLSGLRGKVAVLLFGGIQDPQCRDEIKALQSLADRYQGKNVSIYWVSVNTPGEASNDQINTSCGPVGSVVVLRDSNRAAFKRFSGKVPQLPTVVVLNQQGEPQGSPRGGFNPNSDFVNDMAAIIDSLLKK
jgi:peroxiredoxin